MVAGEREEAKHLQTRANGMANAEVAIRGHVLGTETAPQPALACSSLNGSGSH
jgi:hypothetical protein